MQSLAGAGGAGAGAPAREGFSASNSTVSSPPDPRTPPVSAQDLYAPSSYTDSFASLSSDATTSTNSTNTTVPAPYADQHQHQHAHSFHHHPQQQQQQPHHAYGPSHGVGAGVGDESMMGAGSRLQPPSPAGYPLPPSVSHSLNSSAASSPPKDYLPQLQQQPGGGHAAAGDYGYGLPPPQVNPIDMVRHGSFSSVASSSGYDYTAAAAGGDDNGPPALEKAPPEVTGAFHHPWSHHASSEAAFHPAQPPQHPPALPHHSAGIPAPHHPVQHQHQPAQPPQYPPSRRGSFLEDLYTPSHSPSSHDFPNAATHHHIPPPAHHQHHHAHQQQDVSPLSRPLSDLAPSLGAPSQQQQQQQQAPLPRISTQFDDPSWPPATVSPEMTQHQPTSAVSPTTTLNGPYPNSTGGGEYGNNHAGGSGTGSGSATPQQGMFHHGHTPQPPFARRFSSPLVGAAQNRGYEAGGSSMTIGAGAGANAAAGGSPHSFPSLGQPDASHMTVTSFGAGNFAFRPPPLYDDAQDMSDRFEGVANGQTSHTITRHPSLPHLSSMGREPMYQGQLSHQSGAFMSNNNSPPSLADSRFAHRSNSLPSSALLLNPLQLNGSQASSHSPPQLHHAPSHGHNLFPHQQHRSVSIGKQHPQMAPPVGPIMHTDDAASKETANLRRKCYNCQTTEPPSWRRSTLTPGKIVCNRCGLYERTHLRPRPCGTGGELRKASVSMAAAAAAAAGRNPSGGAGGPPALAPSPYTTSPVNSKTGAPVRTSKKAAATMAAMGVPHQTPPSLEQQHPHHVPQHERSLSHSFTTPPEWEDSKNVLVPQHHHQQHYAMPPMGGVPDMPLRPLAHAHSMQ